MSRHICWSVSVGRKRHNRVTVFQRVNMLTLEMRCDGQTTNLGHFDRARAVEQARERAETMRRDRGTHLPTAQLIAIRADLIRVARMLGAPEGVAPPRAKYGKLGIYSESKARGAFRGFVKLGKSVNPRDQWSDAMRKFGLRMWVTETRGITKGGVAADIRRVAMLAGAPRVLPSKARYDRDGKWSSTAACSALGITGWTKAAQMLELEVSTRRLNMARRCQEWFAKPATPHEQRTGKAA